MSIGSTVPPRAYTREILTTAFNWLQSQPDTVRTKATTPDALVGLYTQALRGGSPAAGFDAEAPVSSQAFMSDLKNLARGLEEFDESLPPKAVTPPLSSRAQCGQASMYPQSALATMPNTRPEASPATKSPGPISAPAAFPPSAPLSALDAPLPATISGLNERSLQMLRDVQVAMNLSSDVEAMNLMIAIAHKSLKSLLA